MSTVWSLKNVDINDFLSIVNSCKGNLYLVTPEGDKLNLKSTLCQLVGLSKLIEGGIVADASLVCDNIEDETILVKYKLYKSLDAE
ncbi:MAG: hypothetical protein LBL82_06785 [Oscillospiraceae bacterium]|nr:hypothetical protein [Oscillospiraceae bacterium]